MANTKVNEELEFIDLDKEENTEKKGFIKNLKTNKKLLIGIGAWALAGTIGIGSIVYFSKKEDTTIKTKLEDTLKRNNENTLLDEIIYFDGNIGDKINNINIIDINFFFITFTFL